MIYVFYNNDPLAEDQGGGAEHFRALHRALERAGADYRLIAARLQGDRRHPRVEYVSTGAGFLRFYLASWLWFWRRRRAFGPGDVFHFHRNYAAWPKYLLAPRSGRVLISYHGITGRVLESRFGRLARPVRRLMLALERRAVRRADRILCVHAGDRDALRRLVADAPFARAEVVPASFDPRPFAGLPPPTPASAGRLLFVGRICAIKNAPLAVAVLEELARRGTDCTLTIVGDGEEARALVRRIARSPVAGRIRWLGRVPHRDVPALLATHGVVLVTSRSEASPTVVKEALAAGRPVVTTPVGDVACWVEEGVTGFIRPPEAGVLADAVLAAQRLILEGRCRPSRRVAAASEHLVMDRVVALYRELGAG